MCRSRGVGPGVGRPIADRFWCGVDFSSAETSPVDFLVRMPVDGGVWIPRLIFCCRGRRETRRLGLSVESARAARAVSAAEGVS